MIIRLVAPLVLTAGLSLAPTADQGAAPPPSRGQERVLDCWARTVHASARPVDQGTPCPADGTEEALPEDIETDLRGSAAV